MKNKPDNSFRSLTAALKTASAAARRKAFRKGLPVAISRNGKIFLVYKNNREVPVNTATE